MTTLKPEVLAGLKFILAYINRMERADDKELTSKEIIEDIENFIALIEGP